MEFTLRLMFVILLAAINAGVGFAAPAQLPLNLDRYRGKVVIVDFWASWCKPCRQSIPWLNEMRARYAELGLVIVGVNVDAQRSDADRFLSETPIQFDVVFDSKGDLARQFALKGMPSSFIFNRGGELVATHVGFREGRKADNEATLQKLLTQSPE